MKMRVTLLHVFQENIFIYKKRKDRLVEPINQAYLPMGSSSSKKTTAKSLTTGAKTGVIILPKRKLKKFPSQLLKSPLEQFAKVRSLDLSSNYLKSIGSIHCLTIVGQIVGRWM